jgi:hypothetical protein
VASAPWRSCGRTQRRLGRAVDCAASQAAARAGHRCGQDDRTAVRNDRDRVLDQEECALDVDIEPMSSRTSASSRLLRTCRCAVGTCRPGAAARHLSRWRCRRRGGQHPRSEFPRSARSAGRRRAARGAGAPIAFCLIRTPSLARGFWSNDSQYSAGSASSGAGAGTAGLRAASAASFFICLGVGMRQLAVGRSWLD